MIQGYLAEVKICRQLRWWFSTSPGGGFRPNLPRRSCSTAALGCGFSSDPRSSASIRSKGFALGFSRSVSSVLISGEIYFTVRRNPHSISTADPTIASPTDINIAVINVSCQGKAWCPAPVIGESAAIPQAAPSAVVAQFR
jgi:hypothetical protein